MSLLSLPPSSPDSAVSLPSVQQAHVCAHQPEQPELQRPPAGVCGHQTDLRQIPREERRPQGAVRQGPAERFLPDQVLGEQTNTIVCFFFSLSSLGSETISY